MKNISVQTFKMGCDKCQQAELITPSMIYVVTNPPRGGGGSVAYFCSKGSWRCDWPNF